MQRHDFLIFHPRIGCVELCDRKGYLTNICGWLNVVLYQKPEEVKKKVV